ncbi:3-isopropylmalate dehydrogenase [Stagnimonas aquatica]|uniref:3-isopropylmalate dehydrogenase n=1 Tax=Stagnimonas aquatica TaxID=2689987 RepID=A0A3N0UYS5_9GAMM|nr:3-isopropylmalate dehydrogenase [Stagnimonas aquatica]ROH85633.1 3-isopropylmalate dehydrogenase [Stagnimonas aquatica]
MTAKILLLPGDGLGPEVVAEAEKVLAALRDRHGLDVSWEYGLIGGAGYDAHGEPLPAVTLEKARGADAILLGAVGGPKYDTLPKDKRPERGLLGIRAALGLYANLRPALLYKELAGASSLKPELVAGLDILIVRELTGGIYFGKRSSAVVENYSVGSHTVAQARVASDTEAYSDFEIERIVRTAFEAARLRNKKLCSVDKANVLESSQLWREVVLEVAKDYPDVEVSHLYVDNAAMQLVRAPKQFDVIVTNNIFGDILSDIAAQLTGSIGMLPSASMNAQGQGLYEPIHGSAPDIAGRGIANPLATLLSLAMLLRYSLKRGDLADKLEQAVQQVLASGLRTGDIAAPGEAKVGTQAMGDAVIARL